VKRVLITGGAGFIGLHLASRLAAEPGIERIDLVDDFSRAVQDPDLAALLADGRVQCRRCDLTDTAQVAALPDDYDVIYHFAAIIGVVHVLERPYDVLTLNVRMLENALALARRQRRLSRFFFASTSEVYAGTLRYFELPMPTPESTPLAVTDPAEARTSYMLSKIYGESMCAHSGVPYTVVRPHNIYGPRMGLVHVIPELMKKARLIEPGGSLPVFSVDHRRTFCYVADAVEMLRRMAATADCAYQVLNLGAESPEISIGELARTVLAAIGRTDLTIAAQPASPGSPARRAPDMGKLTGLIGWQAETSLADGIARTWEWYRTHVFEGGGPSAR